MAKKITDKDVVKTMSDTDAIFGNFGGKLAQMSISDFRTHLNDNDNQVLNDLAFYIDINTPSSKGATRVDVGGNLHMRELWEDSGVDVIMDANGNYSELNPNDSRYTKEGEAVVDLETNEVVAKYAHCDFMRIIPQYYGHVQMIQVGATTRLRPWFSLVPLPNGYIIPMQVVGKFKASLVGSVLRSLPNKKPEGSRTINVFWNFAQARSKSHGLANFDFRNHLLFHMMAKYGWRDSQNCKGSDGTLVWGVGLDGTESASGWNDQNGIKSGHTLSLGSHDGKAAIVDAQGKTVHGVNVCGFENPWGQYWEMVQGICSVGNDVYCWRGNVMPTGTPTADAFAKIDHVVVQRATSSGYDKTGMNIIANKDGQGVYMIPKESLGGISYGDYYYYSAGGQLWLCGGASYDGSYCGLACADSSYGGSTSYSNFSARLAFYGSVKKVSPTQLASN